MSNRILRVLARAGISRHDSGDNGIQWHSRRSWFFLSHGGDIFLFHVVFGRVSFSVDAKGA